MELIARRRDRIDIMDAVRGVAILVMVIYHALYDVNDVFGVHVGIFNALSVLEPPVAGVFILLCGISSRFSRSNLRRGVRLLAVALAITAVTILFSAFVSPGEEIYFGILHFLAIAILLYVLMRRFLDRIPPAAPLVICLLLFAATYRMPVEYQIGLPGLPYLQLPSSIAYFSQWAVGVLGLPGWAAGVIGLYPFGLPGVEFSSADYFPLVPWLFLFLAGTIIGKPIQEHRLPEWFYRLRVPFFAAIGRNSLLIYVLHQPALYAAMLLIFSILQKCS